jgi:pimeloyl-ACP methyl ester carboxylesterase
MDIRALFAALPFALLAAACGETSTPPALDAGADARTGGCGEDVEPPGIAWEDCFDGYRCATIDVPLDHSDPEGATIGVRVLRSPAACPSMREGVLTFNLGGPGGLAIAAGVSILPTLQTIAPRLRRLFDVVFVDPRGIGESTPLDCVPDAWLDGVRTSVPLEPDTDDEWAALAAALDELAVGCEAAEPSGLLSHMSTEDVARDLDLVRERLGYETWDYIGVSYGTVLGATYATLFPDRIRAFVLDSSMILGADVFETYRAAEEAYDVELGRFFEACGADPTCAFHGGEGAEAVAAAYDALEATIAGGALSVGGRTLGTIDLAAAVSNTLRFAELESLEALLAAAEDGDGTMLAAQADVFFDRGPGGYANAFEALVAVVQADNLCPEGLDLDALRARWTDAQTFAPRVGVLHHFLAAPCVQWRAPRSTPPLAISAPTAPPLLVLGGRHDPATPIARGEALRAALGNGSHFIAFEGAGHGYLSYSQCVRDAELGFLDDPTTPPGVTSCEPD